jgi:hypothetical protein
MEWEAVHEGRTAYMKVVRLKNTQHFLNVDKSYQLKMEKESGDRLCKSGGL